MLRHTLRKEERIYLRSELELLFASKGSFTSYPFRVIYCRFPKQGEALKMMVSVPKKRLKRAVDRNRIKRLTREAFRLQKILILGKVPSDQTLLIGFVYIGEHVKGYHTVFRGITDALNKLSKHYDDQAPQVD
ncbi:MAG: ribonuclease P protein component [Bacteroidales bacterium]|uniref:ribonuclease P protein component n=1 Tax=Porphyromonas sp. TaxID=1924944 RepID=UPI002974F877|nr:ribonuclease P protein component [Porphyromonas sp.]MDD7437229.1 ribonuclease P protein component [Bacteroidales bacterium]MDY3066480.1 ribonuclease P protein component [Porphyromonas sp.]